MWKKLGKWITNNFGLKVLAVVFAILLWLAIVNVADPDKSVTFTVPVNVVNSEYLEEEGKTYEILDNTDYISFTVSAPRSIVETLTQDDFRAVANMQYIDDSMTMVPITLTPMVYSSQIEITNRNSYMMVSVEDLRTQELEILALTDGRPGGDYFVESAEASPGVVEVTGPESLVDEVAFAVASIDVSDAEGAVSSTEEIVLLRENGNEMDMEHLSMNITETEVTAQIYLSREVPISFKVSGMPAEGYWYDEPEYDVDSIVIEGEPDIISDIEALAFVSSALNVDGARQDVTAEFSLADSLPEGVRLAEGQPETVNVTVPIVEADTMEAEVPADHFSVTGLDRTLTLTVTTDPVTVVMEGAEDDLLLVDTRTLYGTIDASGLEEGSYIIPVSIETDGSFRATAAIPVSIQRTNTSLQ